MNAAEVPLAIDVEELLQLNGIDGSVALANDGGRLSRPAHLAEGAFPEPAPLVQQPRAQGGAMERPACRPGHGADLLALRPWSAHRAARQSDRPVRHADGARLPQGRAAGDALPHRRRSAVTPMCASFVKPNRPRFTDLAGLAAMVEDGAAIGVGGHHFARLPIALLRAVAGRRPKGLRYVSWGGGLPLEMLLEANAVAEHRHLLFQPRHLRPAAAVSRRRRERRHRRARLDRAGDDRGAEGTRGQSRLAAVPASRRLRHDEAHPRRPHRRRSRVGCAGRRHPGARRRCIPAPCQPGRRGR